MSTICPGCKKAARFEKSTEPIGETGFNYNIVRCAACKTAIGVIGIYNTDTQILELREAIRAIAKKVGATVKLSND